MTAQEFFNKWFHFSIRPDGKALNVTMGGGTVRTLIDFNSAIDSATEVDIKRYFEKAVHGKNVGLVHNGLKYATFVTAHNCTQYYYAVLADIELVLSTHATIAVTNIQPVMQQRTVFGNKPDGSPCDPQCPHANWEGECKDECVSNVVNTTETDRVDGYKAFDILKGML